MTALEVPESDVLTLSLSSGERLVGTGGAAAMYQVKTTPATGASYQSKVLDATALARFGALRFLGDGVRVETRSGNVQKPDSAWSPWQSLSKLTKLPTTGEQDWQQSHRRRVAIYKRASCCRASGAAPTFRCTTSRSISDHVSPTSP